MFNRNAASRMAALACSAALTLSVGTAAADMMEQESYWFAAGDQSLPNGQLWTTSYGECWESAFPDGPTNLPPCVVEEVPEEFTVRLNFEFDEFQMQNVVNQDELARLDDYIDDVLATPADEYLTVVGHTDVVGSEAYNYELGLNRAQSVRNYMISRGIPADRIAPAESEGKLDMLPQYPTDSVFQRRVKITSDVN